MGHQLVDAPCNWPYSSFRRYVEQGVYPNDWGADREITLVVQKSPERVAVKGVSNETG